LRERQVAFKLCGGRRYQSVTAAAPTGASGNNGPPREQSSSRHTDLLADFCNKICQKRTHAAQQIASSYTIAACEER